MAGTKPARMPVIIESDTPVRKLFSVKYIGKSALLETARLIIQTKKIPITPPIRLRITDSYKN
jgi:hypothetical protein